MKKILRAVLATIIIAGVISAGLFIHNKNKMKEYSTYCMDRVRHELGEYLENVHMNDSVCSEGVCVYMGGVTYEGEDYGYSCKVYNKENVELKLEPIYDDVCEGDSCSLGLANPASVYCEENGGTLKLEDGSGLCMFPDGSYCEEWSYFRGECQPEDIYYNTLDDENIGFTLPEGAKTSLTSEEIDEIAETNFPKGYFFSTFDSSENLIGDEGDVVYPENLSHTLLIPNHATMASREVISSGIEDGMIYTLTKVTLQDGTEIQVLYINDPVTLNFVAASVENGNITTNYQFTY